MFSKKVNLNKRGEMIAFLKNHFRYNTMNSWNQSTSYANNIKLHNIDKPSDIGEDIWWEMLGITQWKEKLSDLLEAFGRDHNWQWQAGMNGRSGGYIVLYRGGIQPSSYKSYCTHCGQMNFQKVPEGQISICGRCESQARINYSKPHMQIFSWPGKSVDMDEDFHDWSMEELRLRVKLIQEFDYLCDAVIEQYIYICRNYRITEEEILVPETVKVLEPLSGGL